MLLALVSCATPTSPTGGPPDKTGPTITETEPKTGTTNFKGRTITLHFSEFVDRGSLQKAIVVEPNIGIDYNLDWGRTSVEVKFDQDIPDSTTLILTVGTELTDMRSNKMASPKKVAVSTGPEIDKGRISGKILSAQTGEGNEGNRILLYRNPVDLSKEANYVASTDTSGTFLFSYLSPGTYKAFWIDDRNRNKIWELERERAQPFSQEFIQISQDDSTSIGTLYVIHKDTTHPKLQGVGLFSSKRLRMRFSENIKLTDSTSINVTDTTGKPLTQPYPLYISPDQPFVFFAHSKFAFQEASSYNINLDGITDEAGNGLAPDTTITFTGSAQEDTTKQRIIKRNNLAGYFPADPIKVTYAKPISGSTIKDSLVIVEGDTLMSRDSVKVNAYQNKLAISPVRQWRKGLDYEIRVWDPKRSKYLKIRPDIWHSDDLGKLKAVVKDSTLGKIALQVENEESGIHRDTTFADSVTIAKLPPLEYKVTAFKDKNGNGQWDYGGISPFLQPEPYFLQKKVPVKKGMTGNLTITFANRK